MAASQHRCVFVGNIPYDATEEQLVQICEEVGPVVSFRLVIDRETGKPKGYGFCEYKDEETALSARRNLQGYEINGRQLRVDFAENDKNTDRKREQGHGGPGLTVNADPPKQFGGSAVRGDSSLLQPVGLPVAMAAATVMAGALGGAQTGSNVNQNGLQSQPVVGTDPLTLHLAKVPKNQLIEVISELKVMATQNKEQSRQLLLTCPQLAKAVFQAQIMLGMVTPQMLQTPNIWQATGPVAQTPLQDGQQVQQPAINSLPGLPPPAQNKMHLGMVPQSHDQAPGHPNSSFHSQYAPLQQLPVQPRFQTPQLVQHQVIQQVALPTHPKPPANPSIRPEIQVPTSASMVKQEQPSLLLYQGHGAPNSSFLSRPPLPDNGFQPSASVGPSIQSNLNKDFDKTHQYSNDPPWARKADPSPSLHSGLYEKARMANEIPGQVSHPLKRIKLEDGSSTPFSTADANVSVPVPGSSQAFDNSRIQTPKAEGPSESQKRNPELPPDVDSALLQQVLNLTPEQLSSLPPDQQQQVLQLQQMLRQST